MSDRTTIVNLWPTDWTHPACACQPFGSHGRAAASHLLFQGPWLFPRACRRRHCGVMSKHWKPLVWRYNFII